MVDGGSLENCCTATYRGFESLRLRKSDYNPAGGCPTAPVIDRSWQLFVKMAMVCFLQHTIRVYPKTYNSYCL